jgi:phospholipid/cholesterol/gamma-HCH transport system substrate-binding protein
MGLIAVLAACVLVVDCSRLRPGIEVTIFYAHIGGLAEGADVQIAGREVGKVTAVQLLTATAVRDPRHPLHPSGGVAVHVRLQKRYASWAQTDSDYFITAKGIIGEAYIEIGPRSERSPPESDAKSNRMTPWASGQVTRPDRRGLEDGDQVRGADPARMDQVVVRSFQNMTEFRRLLEDIEPSARELRAAVERLSETLRVIEPEPGAWAALGAGITRFRVALDALTSGWEAEGIAPGDLFALADAAGAFADRARAELALVGAALDRLRADLDRARGSIPPETFDRIDRAIAGARTSVAKVERIVATGQELAQRIERGQGTVGALLNDPEFIDDAKQLGRILKREPWRVIGHPSKEALEKQRH